MIHFVPTVVFDFPFTVNKLPLEVDLVRALLPGSPGTLVVAFMSSAAACHCKLRPARRAVKVDSIVALWYE